ncbi:hypothetical protein DBV15_12057 [Temnothorax longispinosus]|uniref:Uncharacterized protein n=1 Tax=Temnothorax longispinosus TaxID=300112 RepID=A0A4S2KZ74_9HYME|nr:hypothetical protein DBV15_12057 [Temnothorax longispinosus]
MLSARRKIAADLFKIGRVKPFPARAMSSRTRNWALSARQIVWTTDSVEYGDTRRTPLEDRNISDLFQFCDNLEKEDFEDNLDRGGNSEIVHSPMRYSNRGERSALRGRWKISRGQGIAFLRDLAQRSLGNFMATTCASARDGETRDVIVGAILNPEDQRIG